MKKICLMFSQIVVLFILCCCDALEDLHCGPIVRNNKLGLQKVSLNQSGISSYKTSYDYNPFESSDSTDKAKEQARVEGIKFTGDEYIHNFFEIDFMGEKYCLFNTFTPRNIHIMRKKDRVEVKKLRCPKGVTSFTAFQIYLKEKPYLVLYAGYKASLNQSSLMLLDEKFDVVYHEDLLMPYDIGYTNSEKYGNCIIVISGEFWYPYPYKTTQVPGNEKQLVNGKWVYFLPDTDSQSDDPTERLSQSPGRP